jgi:hypothetical protein
LELGPKNFGDSKNSEPCTEMCGAQFFVFDIMKMEAGEYVGD